MQIRGSRQSAVGSQEASRHFALCSGSVRALNPFASFDFDLHLARTCATYTTMHAGTEQRKQPMAPECATRPFCALTCVIRAALHCWQAFDAANNQNFRVSTRTPTRAILTIPMTFAPTRRFSCGNYRSNEPQFDLASALLYSFPSRAM